METLNESVTVQGPIFYSVRMAAHTSVCTLFIGNIFVRRILAL